MKAMESWQLNSREHLHLTTSVIAKGANAFISCAGCGARDQKTPGDSLACWKASGGDGVGGPATTMAAPPAMKGGGLSHFVLKANLAALDWA